MRNYSNWSIPRMWEGEECWIIGGGSSLPYQFNVPEDIIEKVRNKILPMSVYSSYMEVLHDKHVIGTNVAYMLGNWISVLYFGDLPFYQHHKHLLKEWHNLKVTDTGNLPVSENYTLHKNIKKVKRDVSYGLSSKPDMIRWNRSAGAGAIDLAVHFGVKRIYLLGYDMCAGADGATHFHAGLPTYSRPTDPTIFVRFMKAFPVISADAKLRKIEILNVNMNSAIPDFKKVKLEDVL